MLRLADCFVGLPNTKPGEMEDKLMQEHMKFLVAELNVSVNFRTLVFGVWV